MLPIKYNATVEYSSTDNKKLRKSYCFFAKDDDNAKDIASELFLIDEGVTADMKVTVSPVSISFAEEQSVDRALVQVLRELDKSVSGDNYVGFLNTFRSFEGKNLKLGNNASFNLEFMGFKVRVEMRNRQSVVCRDEIVYNSPSGRVYVIRCGNVYVGN